MGMMTQAQLRPLTEAERRAVELMDGGADIDDVAIETRLGRAQIVAARDLASLWAAVKRGATGSGAASAAVAAPTPETESTPVDTRPVISIELEPAGTEPSYADEPEIESEPEDDDDPEPVTDTQPLVAPQDVAGLLERGRASGNLRARDLALALDRQLVQLAEILEADERTAQVREEIERLEEALAAKRQELAGLLPAARPKPAFGAPIPNQAPRTVVVGGVRVDRKLYYSETVRAWARSSGHQVAGAGRMPRGVVEAYVAAHPQAAA